MLTRHQLKVGNMLLPRFWSEVGHVLLPWFWSEVSNMLLPWFWAEVSSMSRLLCIWRRLNSLVRHRVWLWHTNIGLLFMMLRLERLIGRRSRLRSGWGRLLFLRRSLLRVGIVRDAQVAQVGWQFSDELGRCAGAGSHGKLLSLRCLLRLMHVLFSRPNTICGRWIGMLPVCTLRWRRALRVLRWLDLLWRRRCLCRVWQRAYGWDRGRWLRRRHKRRNISVL